MSEEISWDWEGFLDSLGRFGIELGLERMTILLDRLGNPQRGIPVIHVAGTNGKGSVCALISHVLWAAGYRVGRYNSPHLVNWRERIWINGEWISAEDWSGILRRLQQTLQEYPPAVPLPTQFDVTTAAAWIYFQQQQVDCVVLEVGLGGRLDSTNAAIDPVVAVITSIGRDHWQRLGDTLPQIAQEKAGICKIGVPIVSAPQKPEVLQVLQTKAEAVEATLQVVTPAKWDAAATIRWQDQSYPMPLRGDVQLINAAVVLQTLRVLQQQGWQISASAIAAGFARTHWPGRLQTVEIGGHTLLLDGAHNQPGAEALRQFLDIHVPTPITWFIGILESKDATGILTALLRPGDRLYPLPMHGYVGFDPAKLARIGQTVQPQLAYCQELSSLKQWMSVLASIPSHPKPNLVLCGSLYLIGQVMQDCLGWQIAQ
jgi:dihydrofolate synthase/folylpolyglutamate synthase